MLIAIIFLQLVMLGNTRNCPTHEGYQNREPASATNRSDHAGPYVITNDDVISGKDRQKLAEIRSFLWEHWHQNRRGILVEKRYSKEGVLTTTTFVFELDEGGTWSLRVTAERPPSKGSDPQHDRMQYRVYSIRRIGAEHEVISEEEKRPGNAYHLVFYDLKGKETGGA